jgi:hypothetical protein
VTVEEFVTVQLRFRTVSVDHHNSITMSSSEEVLFDNEDLFDDERDADIESLSNDSKRNGTNVHQGVNVTRKISNKSSTNLKAGTTKFSGAATEGTESTKKRVVTERSKKYAELATTTLKGVRLNKDAHPTRAKRNGKAMQNQVVLHHASKPHRKVQHCVLKLPQGMVVWYAILKKMPTP